MQIEEFLKEIYYYTKIDSLVEILKRELISTTDKILFSKKQWTNIDTASCVLYINSDVLYDKFKEEENILWVPAPFILLQKDINLIHVSIKEGFIKVVKILDKLKSKISIKLQ